MHNGDMHNGHSIKSLKILCASTEQVGLMYSAWHHKAQLHVQNARFPFLRATNKWYASLKNLNTTANIMVMNNWNAKWTPIMQDWTQIHQIFPTDNCKMTKYYEFCTINFNICICYAYGLSKSISKNYRLIWPTACTNWIFCIIVIIWLNKFGSLFLAALNVINLQQLSDLSISVELIDHIYVAVGQRAKKLRKFHKIRTEKVHTLLPFLSARADLCDSNVSVRPSVCLSVTHRYCVKMKKASVRFLHHLVAPRF